MAPKGGDMAPVFEPSWPQLLAIGKTHSHFEDQLDEAARLADLPLDWERNAGEDYGKPGVQGSQHRAEWVFCWVLERFQDRSSSASKCPRAWVLLQQTMRRLPVSNAARLLNSHEILSIIERTLEEILSGDSQNDENPAKASQSKKRKRTHSSTASRDDPFKACYEIQRFLLFAISLPENDNFLADVVAREHMKAVPRTTSSHAARLLGLWFSCMGRQLQFGTTSWDPTKNLILKPMLTIWESRSLEGDDENGWSSSAFVSETLVRGSLFYVQLCTIDSTPRKVITDQMQSLEHLLARHVLIPARSAFLDAHRSRSTSASFGIAKVMTFFQCLRGEIERSDSSLTDNLPNLREIVPNLLELAIDILPPKSIKRNSEDSAWIEAVFAVLARCCGLDIPEEPPTSVPASLDIASLLDLLEVVKRRKQTLSSGFLQLILATYSGLIAPQDLQSNDESARTARERKEEPVIRWSLIAAIHQVDHTIFTRTTGTLNQEIESTTAFADILLQTISQRKFNIGPEYMQRQSTLNEFIQSIIAPLMEAYSQNRDLTGFITSWYEGLKACNGHLDTSAWGSDSLTGTLTLLLEESMTPLQIVGVLESHVRVLASTDITSMADIIIVDAILQSVMKDETIDRVLPISRSLKDLLMARIESEKSVGNIHWRIWRTLARTFEVLFEAEDPATALRLKQNLSFNGFLNSVSEYIRTTALNSLDASQLYAFDFLATVSSKMIDITELHDAAVRQITDCLQFLSADILTTAASQTSLDTGKSKESTDLNLMITRARIHDFAAVLLKFPNSLHAIEPAIRMPLFHTLMVLANAETDITTSSVTSLLSVSYTDIVSELQNQVLALGNPHLRDDYIDGILEVLKENSKAPSLTLQFLLKLPPTSIQRKHRELIVDVIVDAIKTDLADEPSSITLPAISAVIRLLEAPCLSSDLCSNADTVHELVEYFAKLEKVEEAKEGHDKSQKQSTHDLIACFESLMIMIFRQVASDGNLERRKRYIDKILTGPLSSYAQSVVCALEDFPKAVSTHKGVQLQWDSASYNAMLYSIFSAAKDSADIQERLRKLADTVITSLMKALSIILKLLQAKNITVQDSNFRSAIGMMRISAQFSPDLITEHFSANEWRQVILSGLRDKSNNMHGPEPAIEALKYFWTDATLYDTFGFYKVLLESVSDPQLQAKVLESWRYIVQAEDPLTVARTLQKVFDAGENELLNLAAIELQYTLVQAQKQQEEDDEEDNVSVKVFQAGLLPNFCRVLLAATSIGEFCGLLGCIQTIVSEKVTWSYHGLGLHIANNRFISGLACNPTWSRHTALLPHRHPLFISSPKTMQARRHHLQQALRDNHHAPIPAPQSPRRPLPPAAPGAARPALRPLRGHHHRRQRVARPPAVAPAARLRADGRARLRADGRARRRLRTHPHDAELADGVVRGLSPPSRRRRRARPRRRHEDGPRARRALRAAAAGPLLRAAAARVDGGRGAGRAAAGRVGACGERGWGGAASDE